MSQNITNVQFNGKGYIASKFPIAFGTNYSVFMNVRMLKSDAHGLIFGVGLNQKSSGKAILLQLSHAYGLRFAQHIDGYDNIDINIPVVASLNEWHRVGFSRNNNSWTLIFDDKTLTETHEHPSFPDDIVYIGGRDNIIQPQLLMLQNVCITSININGNPTSLENYTLFGDLSTCPELYYTDNIALNIESTLSCSDSCTTKYLNHITSNVPWENLTCCHSGQITGLCDVGKSSSNESPIVAYQSADNEHVQCIYDRRKIDNLNQAKQSVNLFGEGNVIQNSFCQSRTNNCPSGTFGGCSRYFSPDEAGDYCRNIFNKLTDQEKDTAIANYCSRNDSEDCKCANRSYDEDYMKLKQGNPFSDACWYIPCANSTRYLVPSEFKKSGNCPANMCQIVFDISQAHNVDIDHLKADINCDFSGGKYPSNPTQLWYYIVAYSLIVILLIIYAEK